MDTSTDLSLLHDCQVAARAQGIQGLRWGCVIRTAYTPDNEPALFVTTMGGEQMWLTARLASVLGGFLAQGQCYSFLRPEVFPGDENDFAGDLIITTYIAPMPGEIDRALRAEHAYEVGRTDALVCLTTERPREWPL